jgi:hypothetical protein
MQRAYPWLTAILLLVFLTLGYLLLREKTEIVAVGLRRDDDDRAARAQAVDLQHQLIAAKNAQARAEKQLAELRQTAAAPTKAVADDSDGMKTIHISDIIKEHPEFAGYWAAQQRRNVFQQFGPALAKLNLPPEQLAKLRDLLLEREMSSTDAAQAAEAAGLKQGSPGWRDAMTQATAAAEQDITNLMGTNGTSFVQRLQAQVNFQNQVENTYAPDFADQGAALSSEQAAALAQAMSDANYAGKSTADRPANYNQVDPTTGLTPHESRVLQNAATSLTPAQVEIYKADLLQSHQQAAIMKEYQNGPNGRVNFEP